MSQNKKIVEEEEALQNALAPIVNKLIDKNFENSGDKIASQMAPLIGGAIREQIKSQKDDVVDALYPVMGNMIAKFVTKSLEELLNKINEQIQNGLSIQAVKRKIKAKIKGVSETELLLQESSEAYIKAVLLIHKESGSLLCKVEDEHATLSDADMLASMMSAIRSFVNEWISANESHQELGEIEYGGNKIIIEASGYSYLAVIVEGAAYTKTYKKIRSALEEIVLEYGQNIKDFQGSFETFPKESIEKRLQQLLLNNPETTEESKKKSPLFFVLPLLIVGYLAYLVYNDYTDEKLQEEIKTEIEATPQLIPYKIDVDVEDKRATITGAVPFSYHKKLLESKLQTIKGLQAVEDKVAVIPTLTDPMQVSAHIAYLLKGANLNLKTNISYDFDYNTLTLYGSVADKKLKEKILKELHQIRGIKDIKEKLTLPKKAKLPQIDYKFYFKKSSADLSEQAKKSLLELHTILEKFPSAIIELKAYSDMIGNKTKNRVLAKKRIKSITQFLHNNMKITNPLTIEIFDTPPPGVDPKTNPKEARSIILTLKGNTNNV